MDDLAEPSDRFMDLLAKYLPEPERSSMDKMRGAQMKWKRGRGEVEVIKPFAGNVTGQGPGFAELPLRGTWKVGLLAAGLQEAVQGRGYARNARPWQAT